MIIRTCTEIRKRFIKDGYVIEDTLEDTRNLFLLPYISFASNKITEKYFSLYLNNSYISCFVNFKMLSILGEISGEGQFLGEGKFLRLIYYVTRCEVSLTKQG